MKKFNFSLQKLLNYKEQLLENEKNILGDMRALLTKMEEECELLKAERILRVAEYNRQAADGILPSEIQRHKVYLKALDESIEQKLLQIEMQKHAVDKQMDVVRAAKVEISTMEKLKEKKLEEYNYISSKADESFIEEFISNQRAAVKA